MGPTGCTEMSVRNYHYQQLNNREQHSSLTESVCEMDCIHSAQVTNLLWDIVKTLFHFQIPKNGKISWPVELLLS
jgi:hypothetical protein